MGAQVALGLDLAGESIVGKVLWEKENPDRITRKK